MSKAERLADRGAGHRASKLPKDDDEQTQIELEMAASGRTDVVPREGLVGAHVERRAPPAPEGAEGSARAAGGNVGNTDEESEQSEEGQEPTGPGSDVAPTK